MIIFRNSYSDNLFKKFKLNSTAKSEALQERKGQQVSEQITEQITEPITEPEQPQPGASLETNPVQVEPED